MKVKDIMKTVQTLAPDATLAHAAEVMTQCDVSLVPVGVEDRLHGVVTPRAIASAAATESFKADEMPVDEVLNRAIGFCQEGDTLGDALETMRSCHTSQLVVRDTEKGIVGVLALEDILEAESDLQIASAENRVREKGG